MKSIIAALQAQASLEPLIALERCAEPGDTFEGESLGVRHDNGAQVIHPAGSPADILVTGALVGDTMTLALTAPVEQIPSDLLTCLRLLGTTAKGAVATGAGIDLDQYLTRVQTLEHVAILARFASENDLGPVAENVEAVLNVARNYRIRRDAVFELENSSTTRPRTLAAAQQQLQQACAEVHSLQQQLGTRSRLKLLDDPRGSALEWYAACDRRSVALVGANITWAIPDVLQQPAKRKRGSAVTARRSGDCDGFTPNSSTAVDPDVVAALQSAVARGQQIAIGERLDPRTYAKVKALLSALGGRWSSSKQAHVFAGDAEEVLRNLMGGAVVTDRDWEFFPTPKPVVDRMLAKADVQPGWRVREPQAGQGAIAVALAAVVGIDNVICTEAMPRNAQHLRGLGFTVREGDFLQETPTPSCRAILMNPPFSGHQDVTHITHALGFLHPGGVLVSVASPSWRHANNAKAAAFRELLEAMDAEVEDIPGGAFRESGTDIATVLITIRMPCVGVDRSTEPSQPAPAGQLELCL